MHLFKRSILFLLVLSFDSLAKEQSNELQKCLKKQVVSAESSITVSELIRICETTIETQPTKENAQQKRPFAKRLKIEALDRSNRFMLTPHKRNYFYPISHTRAPNNSPYQQTNSSFTKLDHTEAELQLSIKILLRESIFDDNGHLYLGYTNHSFWQVYSDTDSAPFRATDHQPELILSFSNDWTLLGFQNSANQFIVNHQSNGTGGLLSRSWNRLMFTSVFERDNFVFSLSPWYRIPEPKQKYPGDPDGDDNPDITHFLGNVEFSSAYKKDNHIVSLMLRNNVDADNKGASEIGWSFPVTQNIRGQLNYFNGYGYSLIDYNQDMEVFSLGIVFTDLF